MNFLDEVTYNIQPGEEVPNTVKPDDTVNIGDHSMEEKKGKDIDGDGDVDSDDYLAARDAAIKKAKSMKELKNENEKFNVIVKKTGEIIDDKLPKDLALKLAAKKNGWAIQKVEETLNKFDNKSIKEGVAKDLEIKAMEASSLEEFLDDVYQDYPQHKDNFDIKDNGRMQSSELYGPLSYYNKSITNTDTPGDSFADLNSVAKLSIVTFIALAPSDLACETKSTLNGLLRSESSNIVR